jgi:hypothetical protein
MLYFRAKLNDILPDDFKNDFFMGRWLRAYKGDEVKIEEKLKEVESIHKKYI